jgi:UDP-N-acetylglucosamine--N-acetylmuramyl-(pentapeptide) pyrophosphoryl-undecaprenol N-acetylglucosamine transferase
MSAVDAWKVISRHRPSVVVGVGGYSSGPVVMLAALRGVPTLVMEQNAMPGVTNRLLAWVVRSAAVTYQESIRFFGSKAFVAGNPVRSEFFGPGGFDSGDRREEVHDEERLPPGAARVLVFGGSQGAHAINMAMVEAAPRLASATPRLAITHQTGERDLEMVRTGYRRAGLEARVEPFLYAMDREMRAADVVVCRAGATTLAELMAAGRPSILVPLPSAADDHQRKNAEVLAARGAAQMLEQRDLSGHRLAAEIITLASDEQRKRQMSDAARRTATPHAARVIVDKILELAARTRAW